MSDAINQGQVKVARILREVASEQGVRLKAVQWWSSTTEVPPLKHTLEVTGSTGWVEEKDFTLEQMTGCQTDNQMKVQVYQKIAGIIGKLKKHEREVNQ